MRKESRKDQALKFFSQPLRGKIDEWDGLSHQRQTVLRLKEGAWVVDHDTFESHVFGDKVEALERFIAELTERQLEKPT